MTINIPDENWPCDNPDFIVKRVSDTTIGVLNSHTKELIYSRVTVEDWPVEFTVGICKTFVENISKLRCDWRYGVPLSRELLLSVGNGTISAEAASAILVREAFEEGVDHAKDNSNSNS